LSAGWEQGEDLSMVDFRCTEYARGNVVADPEGMKRIIETGIRKVARESKVCRETVALIAKGGRVKASTLAKVVAFLQTVSV
jgi:hypothetical protein